MLAHTYVLLNKVHMRPCLDHKYSEKKVIKIVLLSADILGRGSILYFIHPVKGMYYCPIEIIKGLTDKGQFQYLTKLKGPQMGNYLYTTQFLSLRKRSIFYHKLPNPFIGPLYCPFREVIITSL